MKKQYTPTSLLEAVFNSQAFLIIAAAVAVICSGTGIGIVVLNNSSKPDEQIITTTVRSAKFAAVDQILNLEIANTPKMREQGLMFRTELPSNSGMLFTFDEPQPLTFWMKNTFISLDIIFMDKDFKVINIHKSTKTNQITELYSAIAPAKYVLEVNSGWSDAHNLQTGDRLNLI